MFQGWPEMSKTYFQTQGHNGKFFVQNLAGSGFFGRRIFEEFFWGTYVGLM